MAAKGVLVGLVGGLLRSKIGRESIWLPEHLQA